MNPRTLAFVLTVTLGSTAALAADVPMWIPDPEKAGEFRLDPKALSDELARAPREFTHEAENTVVTISLPRPDGTLGRFRVEESPILPPELSDKYGIRTWIGRSIDEPGAITRFSLGPEGLNALILAPSGSVVIRPTRGPDHAHVAVRYEDDPLREEVGCMGQDDAFSAPTAGPSIRDTAGTVSIYHLAVSATGEFTAQNGTTVASAFAAITNVINAVNLIYRRDFGVHLELLAQSEQLIQTAPSSYLPSGDLQCEGPVDCLSPDCLLDANQCLLDGLVGTDNYDVGIIFDATGPSGGSGRAALYAVCDPANKGRGATAGTSIELTAHELGHMFGGHHTFNDGTNGSCGNANQRDAPWAYEPASGSTVMSYAGTCGPANLQGSRDLSFLGDNIRETLGFILAGNATACAGTGFSGNYGPIVQVHPGDHTIPASTPFLLTVQAYDPNDDPITYSFEESDVGTASPPEGDDGSRPIFRAFPPSASDFRYLPRLINILNNANVPPATYTCGTATCLTGESLPTTSRVMDWTVVLRDGVDGVTFSGATITVDGTSGPFAVTQPTGTTYWTEGTSKTVTWNPANTQNPPVSCANVRIVLSTDGGSTWPYVLASSTPNDGAETVTLPFHPTGLARIKVEAVGNIFFDISAGFAIDPLRVSTNADSGRGSLRQAILDANEWPNGATIPLQIPGSGVRTIQVLSQLPTILKPVALDAWELGGPGYVGPPLLELVGTGCPDPAFGVPCDGLVVQGDNGLINGLIVRNFAGNGIVLRGAGAYANLIQNSYIGTDAAGAAAAGNGRSGILIDGGLPDPLYGNGIVQNVISGNQVGVTITGASAAGNSLLRNKIGTDVAGTLRIPNLDDGVRIVGAPNTIVGQPGDGNLISGNGTVLNGFVNRYAEAIDVSGATASGTSIRSNILGLDAAGTVPLYNTVGGIRIVDAPNTLVGGTAAGAGNVVGDDGTINYHAAHCILVQGAAAGGTVIQGNFLGTDVTGTLDRGCRGAGVFLEAAPPVQIGGTTPQARNVISGNNDYGGIYSANGSWGAVIQGNYIGTDVTGMLPLGNESNGITLRGGGSNVIGGTAPGAGNVISANAQQGIEIAETPASGSVIQGNHIGTDAAGTGDLGNGLRGIMIIRAQDTQIGGATASARNVISGNGSAGIHVAGGTVGNSCAGTVIQGNYIGTDATGTAAVGNATGIQLEYVTDTTIAGNVLSASTAGPGVGHFSFGFPTSGVVIAGNRIGTNAAGTAPLGNNGEGISGSISGTASILGNVIGGNALNGIGMNQGSFTVQGNAIGTDPTGTLNLGNAWSGIYTASPQPCTIGGTGPGEGNVIAFNAPPNTGTNYAGIQVQSNANGQTLRGNRWFSNTGLGIDLHFAGAAFPNDHCDPDSGPNGIQNFPTVTTTYASGSSTRVAGTLDSTASTTFTVDFYASPSCDPLGFGEGATWLGTTDVTTDGSCAGSFDVLVPVPVSGVVTATATGPSGSTSEFSACAAIGSSPVAEVLDVAWASKSEMSWSPATGATSYRVIRGGPASLPDLLDTDPDSCTRLAIASLTTGPILDEDPASAGVGFYWYLVVGTNGTDDGPAGGARVANEGGACP